jgi:hypothetical protein
MRSRRFSSTASSEGRNDGGSRDHAHAPARHVSVRKLDAEYPYHDPEGVERFVHVRWREPKSFSYAQRRQSAAGQYEYLWTFPQEWSALIYRLTEVLDGCRRRQGVWLAEGEKDADTLAELGLVASSHRVNGVFSVPHATWLQGASFVVVCMDNDGGPGAKYAWQAYQALQAIGFDMARVTVACPPDGAGHKDVTEHMEAGRAIEELAPVDPGWLASQSSLVRRSDLRRAGYLPSRR